MEIKSALTRFDTWLTTFKTAHIFALIGRLVYGNALFNGFVWDDIPQLLNYSLSHSISNTPEIIFSKHPTLFYRPAATLFQAVIYSAFGPTAFWFHFFQILLHIVNKTMVFVLLQRYLKRLAAFAAALVFLVHPMNIEAV
jgi:hypothetical protein